MVLPALLTSVCCTPADASLKPTLAFVTAVKDIVWLAACGLASAGTADAPPGAGAPATPAPMMEVRSLMVLPFLRGSPAPGFSGSHMLGPAAVRGRPARGRSSAPLVRPEDYAGLAVRAAPASLRAAPGRPL